ncbi:DUF6587 family protein [Dokdonella soli]|uniref:Uncharacterized protein n=1 Tax=Dokdonella soli TaxID=529810 RepID=A0ABN1IIW8_9GAMM
MSTPMLVQTLVIALTVGWSVLFAARRLLPVASRRVQARIVDLFDRPSLPAWLRRLAHGLQPQSTSGGSCGDGCSSCGGCAAAAAKPVVDRQPLMFRPRAKP